MKIPVEQIDADAQKIVRRLVASGFAAYLVGGCVRDLLLGLKPKDFDIATSATPNEIKALFRNCRIIGRRFRLAHIFFGSKIIETSTFRANPRDSETSEVGDESNELLIRRDNVFGSAEEDAARRDFTINGLFYDLEAETVIDYVGGLPDLDKRLVRTIGDPDIRFREDPVRMLRAIKFAARLDFSIEPAAYAALERHQGEVLKSAPPRVLEEIYRLLRTGWAQRSLTLLERTGMLELLIPTLGKAAAQPPMHQRLHQLLERLDERAPPQSPHSNALVLAVLVAIVHNGTDDAQNDFEALETRWRAITQELRASRRDSECSRQILLAQRRLVPNARRKSRPMSLTKREWFAEALALFEITRGDDPALTETIARWQRLQENSGTPAHFAPPSDGLPARRRRRRGGRRRRRVRDAAPPTGESIQT